MFVMIPSKQFPLAGRHRGAAATMLYWLFSANSSITVRECIFNRYSNDFPLIFLKESFPPSAEEKSFFISCFQLKFCARVRQHFNFRFFVSSTRTSWEDFLASPASARRNLFPLIKRTFVECSKTEAT